MVFTSAYRRFYKKPLWDDFGVQEWERKLQYRSDRRSLEHRHEPWLWDSDTDEEDVEEVESQIQNHDGGELPRVFEHGDQRVPKLAWNEDEDGKDEERRKEKRVKDDKGKAKDREGKSAENNDNNKQVDAHPKRDRLERQRMQRRIVEGKPKRHRLSEQSSKRAKDSVTRPKSPPFLPYGWANRGVPVENMKTYNVFASPPEVYPAALRAAKRREEDIKTKTKRYEEALRKKEIQPTIEDSYPTYPKSMWLTEYQRNFCRPVNQKLKV